MVVIARPAVTKVSFVDEDSTDVNVTITYQVNVGTARLRLIAVSKATNVSTDNYSEIEHYTNLDVAETEYTLQLEPKYYKFVLEEINSSGTTIHSNATDPLDLTALPVRPTQTYLRSYRNSIVVDTNLSLATTIYRRDDPLYSFNFVMDVFNLDTNTAISKTLNNKEDSDITVNTDTNTYQVHFCDLDVNSNFLPVYHTERVLNGTLFVSKDTVELAEATTNDVAEIADLEGNYFTQPCFPNASAELDENDSPVKPTGLELTWANTSGALYDPACPEEINVATRFKVERRVYLSGAAYGTISSTVEDTSGHIITYQDSTSLVEGTVYQYRLSAGVKDLDTNITTFGEEYYYLVIPFYTTPDKLVVSITGASTPSVSTHVPHVKNSETGIQLNWTALQTADLNGYTIKDDEIIIVPIAGGGDTVVKENSDLYHRFTGLTKGTTYTKRLSYYSLVSNWYDLVQAATSPYGSPFSTISFIPYEDLEPVTDLAVSFSPLYTAYSATATASAHLTWTAPADCGLGPPINYTVTVKRTAVPEESITELTVVDGAVVTATEYDCLLIPGFNYTFTVVASQYEPICNITETSEARSVDEDALMLSSAVKNLSVYYYSRETSYPEPVSTAPVTAWNTTVQNISEIQISADRPDHPSWRIGSVYAAKFTAPDNTTAITDGLVGTDSSPSLELFNPNRFQTTGWNTAIHPFVDDTTYTVTVTPRVNDNQDLAGAVATTTFAFYELPQITAVTLVANRNQTMTATWDNFTNTNLRYDIFLKTDSDDPVFIHRITDNTNTYTINKQYDSTNSLVSGSDYVVYVRAWRMIGSVGYISNAVASASRQYFEEASISIPTVQNKTAIVDPITTVEGQDVLGVFKDVDGNLLTLNLDPTVTLNGLDPDHVSYRLECKSVLSKGFNNSDDSTSSLFSTAVTTNLDEWTLWDTTGLPTEASDPQYSAIPLNRLGYYRFRAVITSFRDPNTGTDVSVSIASNEVDFLVVSNPVIIATSIVHTFTGTTSKTDNLTANLYNQWSFITSGLAVIVPSAQEKYRASTLKEFSASGFDDNSATNAQKLARYTGTGTGEGLVQTFQVTYTGLLQINIPIQRTFITVNNSVGLDYIYDEYVA